MTLYTVIDEHETCYLHFQGITVSDFSTREDGGGALLRNVTPFYQTARRHVLKPTIFITYCRRNIMSQLSTVALVEPSIFEDWCRILVLVLENMILPVTVACTHLLLTSRKRNYALLAVDTIIILRAQWRTMNLQVDKTTHDKRNSFKRCQNQEMACGFQHSTPAFLRLGCHSSSEKLLHEYSGIYLYCVIQMTSSFRQSTCV